MQDFLQHNPQLPHDVLPAFAMEQMRRDLDGYRINAPSADLPAWAQDYNAAELARMENAFQFPTTNAVSRQAPISQSHGLSSYENPHGLEARTLQTPIQRHAGISRFQDHMGMGNMTGPGMGYRNLMGMTSPGFRPMSNLNNSSMSEQTSTGKGKERMMELDEKDWEQQFARMDDLGQEELDAQANEAVEESLNQMDEETLRSVNTAYDYMGDFESIWKNIKAEIAADRDLNGEQDSAYQDPLGKRQSFSNLDAWDGFDSHFHDAFRDPQLGNYLFEQENPFSATKNPFEEGMKIVHEGGNLSLAALAFEASVQQDPQHTQAWYQLGSAQAQNEKEAPAIRALEQALKLDPTHLPALMGLAISYTNEGYDSTAYKTLERWLSIKYPQIINPDALTVDGDYGFTDRHLLHEKVTNLFIRAAQLSPDGEHMDPDVQVGLGVLFYGDEEYAKAVDCFEAALASTEEGTSNEPQQAHLLWNRLGATLANSGRSEDAIGAYEKALNLNPNFVRARYNLGVSCINIGVFKEAVEHLLGALSMHHVVEREGIERVKEVIGEDSSKDTDWAGVERLVGMNQSTNLIETLRRVFGTMGRRDLADKVERGMDVEAFRDEFDF